MFKQFKKSFKQAFNNVKSVGYVIEFDDRYKCITCYNNSNNYCQYCAGTGYKIIAIRKTNVFVDKTPSSYPNDAIQEANYVQYYRDVRNLYLDPDTNINLSPNIHRIVVTLDNRNEIQDIFEVQSIEPVNINNNVIYYSCVISNKNINNTVNKDIYRRLINRKEGGA